MREKFSFFVPFKAEIKNRKNFIEFKHDYKKQQFYLTPSSKPFIKVLNENSTSKFFIDAILHDNPEIAKNYVSRRFNFITDFDEVKRLFKDAENYKYLINAYYDRESQCRVNSVLIMDKDNKKAKIVHLYLVNEPDNFSKWKIYKIEKEFLRYEKSFSGRL